MSIKTNVRSWWTRFLIDATKYYTSKVEPKEPLYELEDIRPPRKGEPAKIIARIKHSHGKVFQSTAVSLVKNDRDKLFGFDKSEIVDIVLASKGAKTISTTHYVGGKYAMLLVAIFCVVYILSNIHSSKVAEIFGFIMTGGTITYPLAYMLSNIITEVYGYKISRVAVWSASISNVLMLLTNWAAVQLDPAPMWHNQEAFATVLCGVPRIVVASLISYWVGEFCNSYILAKLKIMDNGKKLWKRILASSFVAITIDTGLFVLISYYGLLTIEEIIPMTLRVYLFKLFVELISIFFVCMTIAYLKNKEKTDIFDYRTNFSPFSLDIEYHTEDNFWVNNPKKLVLA